MNHQGNEDMNDGNHNSNDDDDAKVRAGTLRQNQTLSENQRRLVETLTQVYKFSVDAAQNAVCAVVPAVTTDNPKNKKNKQNDDDKFNEHVVTCCNYILDKGLGIDQGGPVYPITNCPHLMMMFKNASTTVLADQIRTINNKQNLWNTPCCGGINKISSSLTSSLTSSSSSACPLGENWLCLKCQKCFCSRYVNGHCIDHWKDTSMMDKKENQLGQNSNDDDATEFGHCIAVSLTDLSVWCHVCNSYIKHDTLLQPILQQLQNLKWGGGGEEDRKPRAAAAAAAATSRCMPTLDEGKFEEEDYDEDDLEEYDDMKIDGSNKNNKSTNEKRQEQEDPPSVPALDPSTRMAIRDVAKYMKSDECKRILVLAGAGMSVASGVPDFRSPKHGLYATILGDSKNGNGKPSLSTTTKEQREKIHNDPSYVFTKELFLENSLPCLEVLRPMILGTRRNQQQNQNENENQDEHTTRNEQPKWKPTLAHRFIELLYKKLNNPKKSNNNSNSGNGNGNDDDDDIGDEQKMTQANDTNKLVRLYTQNIDGLEYQCTTLPREVIVPVHGSLANGIECAMCHSTNDDVMDSNEFYHRIRHQIKDVFSSSSTNYEPEQKEEEDQDVESTTTTTTKTMMESMPIECNICGCATVKPNIVLFQEDLPKQYYDFISDDIQDIDMLLIIGTSLQVAPANMIVVQVPSTTKRVLINRDLVGWHLGMRFNQNNNNNENNVATTTKQEDKVEDEDHYQQHRDYFAQGAIEVNILELMIELGWSDDLRSLLLSSTQNGQQQLPESSEWLLRQRLKEEEEQEHHEEI